jgi:5'-nucleotidase / UDP-sugar diphosphatase
MFNVFPFENSITVMYLSGSEVQETLDFVARRSAGRGCRTQAQVAGIWFDMVCGGDCPGGAPACAKNVHLGDDCRGGDPDGPIDPSLCPPLAPTGLYRVAVNDYIARGGSGFEVLKRNTSKQDTGVSLRDALVDYLRRQPACGPDVIDFTDDSAEQATVVERWGQVACLDETIEPHDGRIRPLFE